MLDAKSIAVARRVVADAASSLGDVRTAHILPAEAYTNEHFWEFERHAIFSREWLCVGHENEVAEPGEHLPLDILGEPIIMVRDELGTVRVLSAMCQHRGHPIFGGLAERAPGGTCLKARSLICPYHNWVYGLDGRLIGAPSMHETTPVGELRQTIRLPEIKSEIFHGLVFINFDADAAPLAPQLSKLDAELQTYPLEDLIPTTTLPLFDLGWNWKLHHENAIEPYHTDFVHKGYHGAVPSNLTKFRRFEDGDGQIMRTTGFKSTGSDLFEEEGARLPEIEGLLDEQRGRVLFLSLMPNVFAVIQPSSVSMTILNPQGAGVMNSRRINLFPKKAAADPNFGRITNAQFERNKILIEQDQDTLLALQKAYHSRFTPRGKLAWLETSLPQLNQWLVPRYRRALAEFDS